MSLTATRIAILQQIPEEDFRDAVRGWFEHAGWLVYFTFNSKHSPMGFPDLVMVRGGRLIFAELKAQKAPPPKGLQALWLRLLGQVPCIEVYVWRPLDEEVILGIAA